MGTFPSIVYTNATPKVMTSRSGYAEAHLNLNTNADRIGQAVANIGGVVSNIGLDMQAKEDASELSTIDRKLKESHNAEYLSLQDTQDANARIEINKKAKEERLAIVNSASRANVMNAAKMKLDDYEPQFDENFNRLDHTMRKQRVLDDLDLNVASAVARGDYEGVEKAVSIAVGTGSINESKAELMLVEAKHDIAYNGVRSSALLAKTKEEALKIVNESNLSDDDVLKLEPSISAHFDRISAKQKTTAYEKKNENLNNLGKLFTTNDVMPDDIKNAGFSEETENKMLGYLKVANEKPNPKGTSDGFNIAAQTVAKVSTGEIATDEAYTALYEERYGNQSISNEQFLWGIDKIKNKYPKYLAAELKTTIENNNRNYNYNTRFGGSKENFETNRQLIEMVDRKLKEGQEVTGQDLAGWSARIRQTYINAQNPIYNYTIDTSNRFSRPIEFDEPEAERSMFDIPRGGVIPDPQEPAPMEFPENPSNLYKKLKGTYKPEKEDTDKMGLKALEKSRKAGMGY